MGAEIKESAIPDVEFEDMKHFVPNYPSASIENKSDGGRMRWYPWHSAEHRFNHILNVVDLAACITDHEGADINVVRVAALFHDIPKLEADQEVHTEGGVRVVRESLSSHGDYPDSFVNQVCQTVSNHPYQGSLTDVSPETRCLIGTDILDKIDVNGTALMLLRMDCEARTHIDAAGMVGRVFEHGRDTSDWFETDIVQSPTRQRLKYVKQPRE